MINNKIKVLIVDDQPLVLDLLSRGLSRDPKLDIVGTATDGYLALNIINRVNPQVIILDMVIKCYLCIIPSKVHGKYSIMNLY